MKATYNPNRIRSAFIAILARIYLGIVYVLFLPLFLINPDYACVTLRKVWTTFVLKLCQLFGMILSVKGKIPNGQMIFVSNHTHLFDSIVIPSLISRHTTYINKPISNLLIYVKDFITLSIDKDQKKTISASFFLARLRQECLVRKKSVVIFPEGTRVAHGKRVEYSNVVSVLARYLKIPVVPISLNTNCIFGSNKGFNLDFSKSLDICFHDALTYEEVLIRVMLDINRLEEYQQYKSVPYKELNQVLIKMELNKLDKVFLKSYIAEYLTDFDIVTERPPLLFDQLLHLSIHKHGLPKYVHDKLFKDFVLRVSQVHHLLFEVIPQKSTSEKDALFMGYIRAKVEEGIVRS